MTNVVTVAGSWIPSTPREDLSGDAASQALREYVANPLFRAARFEELVIDDNPYRRPVRPDDLEWLRFDGPLTADSSGPGPAAADGGGCPAGARWSEWSC